MVGPIEILPRFPAHGAGTSRVSAPDPVAASDAMSGRRGSAAPRPAPAEIVIDIDPTGDSRPSSGGAAESGTQQRGRQRALPYNSVSQGRRAPSVAAAGADKASLRKTGAAAYRAADLLIADYAHRGTFFDLKV